MRIRWLLRPRVVKLGLRILVDSRRRFTGKASPSNVAVSLPEGTNVGFVLTNIAARLLLLADRVVCMTGGRPPDRSDVPDPFRPVATGSYREGRRVSDFLLKQSDEEFAKVNKSWRISLLPNKRHQTISNYLTVLLVAG
jgi:hypothetical protein